MQLFSHTIQCRITGFINNELLTTTPIIVLFRHRNQPVQETSLFMKIEPIRPLISSACLWLH